MKIEIEGYRIKSDSHQFIIEKKYVKKKDGEVYYIPQTYYLTLQQAVKALVELHLKESTITELDAFLEILRIIEQDGVKFEYFEGVK